MDDEKHNPPPPISTGTSQKDKRDVSSKSASEYVKSIAAPIFEAALPKETKRDSMTIAKKRFSIVWRPNGYRRQMSISGRSDSTPKTTIKLFKNVKVTKKNLIYISDWPQIKVQLAKNTITAFWCQNIVDGDKEVFHFVRDSIDELDSAIDFKKDSITRELDDVLRVVCRKLGLMSWGECWTRYEDWVKGDEVIDSISPHAIIHDTFFKKVYGDGVEFKQTPSKESPVVHLKNYIRNRAIEDVSPLIADELFAVREALVRVDPLRFLLAEVSCIDDLFRPDFVVLIRSLKSSERLEFENVLFERFNSSL